jgi:predicted transcriptional regulator
MQTASKNQLEDGADMTWNVKMAAQLLSSNSNARTIFRLIEEGRGRASGWSIIKATGLPADEFDRIAAQLKEYGVIEATDAGLDGYYFLTKLGFALRNGYSVAV